MTSAACNTISIISILLLLFSLLARPVLALDIYHKIWYNKSVIAITGSIYQGGDTLPNKKQTSAKVAKTASKILTDNRYSKASKSVAGSALAQTKKTK